jgi:hypothetical protein
MKYQLAANGDQSSLTVFADTVYVTTSDNPNWDQIVQLVLAGDESALDLFSPAKTVSKRFESITDRVKVEGSTITFDNDILDNSLTRQIIRFLDQGVEDFRPLVNFLEKVMINPEKHSQEQLYDWITQHNVSINPDGDLVLFKGVRKTDRNDLDLDANRPFDVYESVHTGRAIVNDRVFEGHIPQWVGAVVEMPRAEVHHDPTNGCSTGLHASSSSQYASQYSGGGTVLEVVVNPRDVVSVPHDGFNKVRVTRYRVVDVDAEQYEEAFVDKWAVQDNTKGTTYQWGDDEDYEDAWRYADEQY